jgi:hypothetical protein
VREGRLRPIAAKTYVRLDENILNQLFMNQAVPAETPKDPTDVFLMSFDQAPIRIRLPLPAPVNVFKLCRIQRVSLSMIFLYERGAFHCTDPRDPQTNHSFRKKQQSHR